MNNNHIRVERENYIGYITLNRPEKLNAITWNMYESIAKAMDELEDDDNVRVIVIRGEGKSFSAGFDMNEPDVTDHVELRKKYDRIAHACRLKIWNNPKPTIAQIHGHCLGGAHDVALSCDLAVATVDAKLGVPEIQFGMGTPFLLMPWVIGLRKTKELLLTGKVISGEVAAEIGLVNYATQEGELETKVQDLAKELAMIPLPAMQLQKRALSRAIEISGFTAAAQSWLDLSSLGTLWKSPEIEEFNRIVSEEGFKAALKWRESQLTNDSELKSEI